MDRIDYITTITATIFVFFTGMLGQFLKGYPITFEDYCNTFLHTLDALPVPIPSTDVETVHYFMYFGSEICIL